MDWIGFDRYFIKNPKTDQEYLKGVDALKSKLSDQGQKPVIVMDARYIGSAQSTLSGIELGEMGMVADSYYELARSERGKFVETDARIKELRRNRNIRRFYK